MSDNMPRLVSRVGSQPSLKGEMEPHNQHKPATQIDNKENMPSPPKIVRGFKNQELYAQNAVLGEREIVTSTGAMSNHGNPRERSGKG
eukprot:1956562-Amphidinium_carterae.2